jgi:hypothetical protein
MFGRILQLQYKEYGPHDRRCFITIDKINMVRSKGTNFEDAVEQLRKTFSVPVVQNATPPEPTEPHDSAPTAKPPRSTKGLPAKFNKPPKNNVLKVFTGMRKKKSTERKQSRPYANK